MSDIAELMRAGNPVPDCESALPDDEFDALLVLTQARSGKMDVRERTETTESSSRQRSGWLVAAVAAAIALFVVGAVAVLASRGGEVPPATTPSSTVATPTTEAAPSTTVPATTTTEATTTTTEPVLDAAAVTFIEALVAEVNAGDVAAVDARLATVSELEHTGGGLDETPVIPYMQFWIETDSTVEVTGCRQSDDGTTRCNVERYSDAEPYAPLPWTGQFQVRRSDESVALLNLRNFESDPWGVAYEDFIRWIRENHYDDLWLVYQNDDPVERAEAQARLLAEYRAQADQNG